MSSRSSILGSFVLALSFLAGCAGDRDAFANPASSAGTPAASGAPAEDSSPTAVIPPGASGKIDTNFGVGGTASGLAGAMATGLTVDARGNIVVTGALLETNESFIARYTPDGTPDATFDDDGVAIVKLAIPGVLSGGVQTSAALPDGSLFSVGAGVKGQGEYLPCVRLTGADGRPVASFQQTGEACFALPLPSTFHHVVRLADGSFIVAGMADTFGDADLLVAKLGANGDLDPSFGIGGVATLPRIGVQSLAGLAVDSKGRIVVGGNCTEVAKGCVWRLDAKGQTDPWFSGGVALTSIGDDPTQMQGQLFGVTLGANDEVYLSASANGHLAITALDASGEPLTSFGTGGTFTRPMGDSSLAVGVAFADGALFASGLQKKGEASQAFALRLSPTGELDSSFHAGGVLDVDHLELIGQMAVTPTHVVVVGSAEQRFSLMRIWR